MSTERIEKLKLEYTGRSVVVDSDRPALARWARQPGRVKTINYNGRALVQFEGADQSWHEIELDDLKVVDTPSPESAGGNGLAGSGQAGSNGQHDESPATRPTTQRLSRLELARMGMQTPHEAR
jgi:hypothetical protein